MTRPSGLEVPTTPLRGTAKSIHGALWRSHNGDVRTLSRGGGVARKRPQSRPVQSSPCGRCRARHCMQASSASTAMRCVPIEATPAVRCWLARSLRRTMYFSACDTPVAGVDYEAISAHEHMRGFGWCGIVRGARKGARWGVSQGGREVSRRGSSANSPSSACRAVPLGVALPRRQYAAEGRQDAGEGYETHQKQSR